MKKFLLSPWWALVTLAAIVLLRWADPQFVESVRLRYFDTVITSTEPKQNDIYTVNVDEAALEKYGQWPWSRASYAKIIEDLYNRNAGLVVFNILMPDADRMGQDALLARTLQQRPVVLSSVPTDRARNQPRQPSSAVIGAEWADQIVQYPALISNVESIEKSAAGVGIVGTMSEVDGVVRRVPQVVTVGDRVYPSVALEALRVAAGDSTFQVKLSEFGVDKVRIPAFGPVVTDNLGRIWIDWSQKSHSVSLTQLPKDFGGAIVVVGITAAGLANPVPTAQGAVYPHDLQAAMIATMANGVAIQRPAWAESLEIVALVLCSVLLLFLTRYVYVGLASVAIISLAGGLGSVWAYHAHLWLVDPTAFVVGVVAVALHAYGTKFVSEFLQKQQIKKQFGTYLSPAMVEKLQKNPELLQLGGEERELSIMFTDVRGFTSISEHYGKDVQGLTKIMNRYMTAMTAKIIENNGTLDKYIGDAQMAFWNAPLDEPQHAKMAVKTALQMIGSLDEFNREIEAEGVPAFGMGLGINSATVVVGNMGSDQRFDYTCLGDGVNLASRLEGQSKPYGVKIVLGPITAQHVQDEYFVLELDKIAVKGKKEGVNIYTVLDTTGADIEAWKSAKEHHDLMIDCYRQQKWATAKKLTQDLVGQFDGNMDHYYEIWLERIDEMSEKTLPQDWDGTFVATSK